MKADCEPRPCLTRTFVRALAAVAILAAISISVEAQPVVNAVENVASYQGATVSPGEMVVIFGTGMGPTQLIPLQLDSTGKISNTLAGVQVLFNGIACPLIYVSANQLAAMVPYEMAGLATAQVHVNYAIVASQPFTVSITQTAPGIFSANASGTGNAAATNADGSYNNDAHPAKRGSYITFYLTGEGPLNPSGSDGNIATGIWSLSFPVVVTIAGVQAQVLYAGGAPGNVNGFAQVNAVVPSTLQYGGDLPIFIKVGDVTSQPGLTIAVDGPPPPPPAAPTNLQAVATSPTTATLNWVNNDPAATGIRIEMQTGSAGTFQDIGPAPSVTSSGITGLLPNTRYTFRVRAQQGNQYSPYSNTANITTPAASPPLTITTASPLPASTVEVAYTLTLSATGGVPAYGWSITAGSLPAGLTLNFPTGSISGTPTVSGIFTFTIQVTDSTGITSSGVFSITVQNSVAAMRTVFLVHGIRQNSSDMFSLAQKLMNTQYGVDSSRFQVDAGFDWRECTQPTGLCSTNCTIQWGADKLARYINSVNPKGDIIIIGYSLGGLLARDLMLNGWEGVVNTRKVTALVTLGTPNVGYPYTSNDSIFSSLCATLGTEMWSNFREQQANKLVDQSAYLVDLNNRWLSTILPSQTQKWLAVSGTFCNDPLRFGDSTNGCPNYNPANDGVVCDQSARYLFSGLLNLNMPTNTWSSPDYAHSNVRIDGFTYNSLFQGTCDWTTKFPLYDPPLNGDLMRVLQEFINGL